MRAKLAHLQKSQDYTDLVGTASPDRSSEDATDSFSPTLPPSARDLGESSQALPHSDPAVSRPGHDPPLPPLLL